MIRTAALFAVVMGSTAARADTATDQADALFRDGRTLMAAGKYTEACTAFERSQRAAPAITTLLNLAGCREKAGQLAAAWLLFSDAERQTRDAADEKNAQLHGVAQTRARKLEPRLSRLTLHVPSHPADGLEVLRNGQRVEPSLWNRAQPVDGGHYTISARAPHVTAWSMQLDISAEGDVRTIEIPDLQPVAVQAPPAGPRATPAPPPGVSAGATTGTTSVSRTGTTTDETGHRSLMLPLITGGGAVILLGAALGLRLSGNSTYDSAKAEMNSQSRRQSLYDSANTRRALSVGAAVAGVGCAGVAVWLYLRQRGIEPTVTAGRPSLSVSPMGVALSGAF